MFFSIVLRIVVLPLRIALLKQPYRNCTRIHTHVTLCVIFMSLSQDTERQGDGAESVLKASPDSKWRHKTVAFAKAKFVPPVTFSALAAGGLSWSRR